VLGAQSSNTTYGAELFDFHFEAVKAHMASFMAGGFQELNEKAKRRSQEAASGE